MKTIKTIKITVNGIGEREAITCPMRCRRVTVREDPTVASWPTTDYNVSDVATGGDYTHRSMGLSMVVADAPQGHDFSPSETVAYIETADTDGTPSGSSTFEVIAEMW